MSVEEKGKQTLLLPEENKKHKINKKAMAATIALLAIGWAALPFIYLLLKARWDKPEVSWFNSKDDSTRPIGKT